MGPIVLAFLSGTAAIVAGTVAHQQLTEVLVPVTAGGFVYIAAADLIPELQHDRSLQALVVQTALISGGIVGDGAAGVRRLTRGAQMETTSIVFRPRVFPVKRARSAAPKRSDDREGGSHRGRISYDLSELKNGGAELFCGSFGTPSESDVRDALGESGASWHELIRRIEKKHPSLRQVWAYTSKSTGWGLRLTQGERVIVYMTPCIGHFLVSFALSEKAVREIVRVGLPKHVIAVIEAARKYAEGRGVRFKVENGEDLEAMEKIAAIKLAN